jgi:integrase/recombinase XerD
MNEEKDLKCWIRKFDDLKQTSLPENYQLLKEYIREVKDTKSKRTNINYLMVLIPFTKWCNKPFVELTKSDLGDYFDTMDGKAENTIANAKKAVKTFLKKINPEVSATIKPKQIKNQKTPDSLLTESEITAMINAAPSAMSKALLACLYDSGARRMELLSTTIADAKFDSYGCLLWLRESKTGARPARLVFASSYLREWLDVHPRKNDKTAPIFCSSRAPYNLISISGLYDMLNAISKKAGVKKKVNCHNWRHTRATDLATKITEQEMKAVLGWTAGSNMASIYVHLSASDINKTMLKVNNIEVGEEDKEPSLLATERCPRCKEINDKNRELCFKCGLPLSEKARREELEDEKKAKEEEQQAIIEMAKRAAIEELMKDIENPKETFK